MSLASTLLHPPRLLAVSSTSATASTFLHGGAAPFPLLPNPNPQRASLPRTVVPTIRAMRSLQGRVVCATNDKTVAVEVVRLAPHPKYKRRVRKKKKYQAHDPDNQFEVGDTVQLEKCRPISKNKTFLAIPVPSRNQKTKKAADPGAAEELGIPLESSQQQEEQA